MERTGRGAAQGALGEHAGEVALVVGRAAAVGDRRGSPRRRSRPPARTAPPTAAAAQQLLRAGQRGSVVGPTALSATPASAIVSPSSHSAAEAAAIAQSPARRSTFSCALPAPGRSGSRTSVEQLAVGDRGHVRAEVELVHRRRSARPRARGSRRSAFSAEQTADRSSAASAWHSEPPIVPRLRTTGSAITCSASRNTGKRSASSSDSSRSTWRVSAPIGSRRPPRGCRRARAGR